MRIQELNEEASTVLNDRGCLLFHQALKSLKERRNEMTNTGDGIEENFGENGEKIYRSNHISCNCTFHIENQVPCRHILMEREDMDLASFDIILFHSRYHRTLSKALDSDILLLENDPSIEDMIMEEEQEMGLDDD